MSDSKAGKIIIIIMRMMKKTKEETVGMSIEHRFDAMVQIEK